MIRISTISISTSHYQAFADLEAENKADNETIQSATRNSTWMVTITPMAKASRPHVEVSLDTAGITIGDVTLQRKIGQGGYGIVFAGQWEDRTVAVKFTQRIAEKSQSSAGSGAAKGAEGEGSAAVTGIHGGFKVRGRWEGSGEWRSVFLGVGGRRWEGLVVSC